MACSFANRTCRAARAGHKTLEHRPAIYAHRLHHQTIRIELKIVLSICYRGAQ